MESLKCINQSTIKLLNKHNLLLILIKKELLREKIENFNLEAIQIKQIIEDFIRSKNFKDEEEFNQTLIEKNITKTDFINTLCLDKKLEEYSLKEFAHQAESHFLKCKNDLDSIVYSMIRVKDPFKAKELYLRIAEGESDLGTIASQFSEGAERITRGIVGPVKLKQAHPLLVDLLRSSKVGHLNEPLRIDNVTVIVRVEAYQDAKFDKNMELQMAQDLFEKELEKEATSLLRDIIDNT